MSTRAMRPLGSPPPPRRRFVAPPAVRLAQVTLLTRIAAVLVMVLAAGGGSARLLVIDATHVVRLPSGALWTGLAPWVVAGSVFEGVLALRLGVLAPYSRRLILVVEAAAIAISGMYVAAGEGGALVVLVCAIATVVLLRRDHVRHSFARAAHERWLVGRRVPSTLYDGYRLPDPQAPPRHQVVGYRVRREETSSV
ncbi:MAG: hypothetical protein ACYDAC_01100 [Candidatus Dormibacteria bacterium]